MSEYLTKLHLQQCCWCPCCGKKMFLKYKDDGPSCTVEYKSIENMFYACEGCTMALSVNTALYHQKKLKKWG